MNKYVDDRKDDPELDRRLADDLAPLHADLDRVLDLDAGLADATLPGRAQSYTDDLDQVLDLDAGLAAILPTAQPSDTATQLDPVTAPASHSSTEPATAETRKTAELLRFARDLAATPADERLRTRLWLPRPDLATIRALVRMGPRTRNPGAAARDLVHVLDRVLTRELDLNRDLAGTLPIALDHALTRALALARDLACALALAREIVLTYGHGRHPYRFLDPTRFYERCASDHDLARELDRALTHARDLARELDLARDLARKLDFALAHGHERNRSLDHDRALDITLNRNRNRALKLASQVDLARDLDLAHELDDTRVGVLNRTDTAGQPLVSAFVRALTVDRSADDLNERGLLEAVEIIERVVSDVVGADLEDVDLTDIPLTGVRWSSTTRWPPDWRDRVRRESARIGPDLWEIGHRGVEAEHVVTMT